MTADIQPVLKLLTTGRPTVCYYHKGDDKSDFWSQARALPLPDRKKVMNLIQRTAENGVSVLLEKFGPIGNDLYAFKLKPGDIRIICFFHPTIGGTLVISHIIRKKKNEYPAGEIQKASNVREQVKDILLIEA